MSVEALLRTDRVFAEDLQALRPHPGQVASAANLRRILAGSAIVASHRGPDCTVVQDAYSLRCSPQVTGAARDTLDDTPPDRLRANSHPRWTTRWSSTMAESSPTATSTAHRSAMPWISLAIPVADVASMSERRTDRLLDAESQQRAACVPRRRSGRRLRAHDRAVHPGLDRLRAQAAAPYRPASIRSLRAPCKKTTSRWAGQLLESSAAPSPD